MHTLQSNILKLSQATSPAALIAAVMLLALIVTSSTNRLSAQSLPTTLPINVPPSVANSNGALGVSYAAIFNPAEPTVSSEDTLENEQWQWSSNCYPTTGTGTVQASYTATLPGTYTSTVTCTVTWQAVNINTGNIDSTPTVQGSGTTIVDISSGGFSVNVNAVLNPTLIAVGQSATGSASSTITATTDAAKAELAQYNPQPTFSVAVTGNPKDTLPAATIGPTGQNLVVSSTDSTTADTYSIVVTATYAWTDTNSNAQYGASGSDTLAETVVIPAVAIKIQNNNIVQNGCTIQGTVALTSPQTLSLPFTIGFSSSSAPLPNPQTTPPTPAATGAVTIPAAVTVPGDGSPVSFTITGAAVSAFINDVYIYASSGATSNNAYLTVWKPVPLIKYIGPFAGTSPIPHDPGKLGVGEIIDLTYGALPAGITPPPISGTWTHSSSTLGSLSVDPGSAYAVYDADYIGYTDTFTLNVTGGPPLTLPTQTIIPPQGFTQVGVSSPNTVYHNGVGSPDGGPLPSVGSARYWCVSPTTVSWQYLKTRDVDVTAAPTGTGTLSWTNIYYHDGGPTKNTDTFWAEYSFSASANAWVSGVLDAVAFQDITVGVGDATYTIPMNYAITEGQNKGIETSTALTMAMSWDEHSTGYADQSKGGIADSAFLLSPYVGPFASW